MFAFSIPFEFATRFILTPPQPLPIKGEGLSRRMLRFFSLPLVGRARVGGGIDRFDRTQLLFSGKLICALLLFLPASASELIDAIAQVRKSVVAIGVYQELGQPPVRLMGTGFAVADGVHIITNAHVLPKSLDAKNHASINAFYGVEERATRIELDVVAEDEEHDLALLQIIGGKLPELVLSRSMEPEGMRAAITGYPVSSLLGLYPIAHEGIISAVKEHSFAAYSPGQLTAEQVRRRRAPFVVYQIDTNAYPGNSGSPLFDPASRQVLGAVQSVAVREKTQISAIESPTGFTFAVPAQFVSALLARNGLPGY